jgi:hypothetical protein
MDAAAPSTSWGGKREKLSMLPLGDHWASMSQWGELVSGPQSGSVAADDLDVKVT